MKFWHRLLPPRLLRALGVSRPRRFTLELHDLSTILSLEELSQREQRSEQEIAQELLRGALRLQKDDQERLHLWHELTPRQQEIAALVCLNYTNRAIGSVLNISPDTVKTHMVHILEKFKLENKVELRQALSRWDFSDWEEKYKE